MWYIICGGILVTIGDIFLKYWIDTSKIVLFACGILMYFIGEILLAFSYKYFNIAVASGILVLLNLFILTIASFILFKQNITPLQIVGLILASVSIIMLEM